MIEFRTLGSIEFRELEAHCAESLLAQPKRLAVLAYLILAAPRGLHRRESLVSLLWSDRTPERGRAALRNAIHFLRKHLGSAAIRSRADELAVDTDTVWCDAITFDTWLGERRAREALELYRGDLLPGLRSAGSPRFAQWLEQERDDFRRKAAEAAWALAGVEEEHRNWISAADYARRATALSGDLEGAVRRLMRLLDRAGDRVAAIREYEAFAARWDRESRIEPSAETRALAEAIRQGSAASAAARSEPATVARRFAGGREPSAPTPGPVASHAREPRGKIAILPFHRTGSGSEHEYLAAGLTHGMIASLSRLSSILVVARTSVDRYGKGEDPQTLRPIAEELGVDTVLQGSLAVSGGRIAIAAQLFDARTGAALWAEIYEREPAELLSVQGELVLTILEVLGVGLSPDEREHLVRRPTAKPAAYELYLRGRWRLNGRSKQDLEAAIRHFEGALELDPGFALAFAGLADAFLLLWPIAGVRMAEARVRAREAARAALRADPLLGEAYATLGLLRGVLEHDWYGAEADFRRAIELSPGYVTAHHWYGAYLAFVGRRFGEASAELELAHELDPLSPIIHDDMGLALLNQGRSREAIQKFREVLALEPTFWRAHYDLGVASTLSGDPVGGVEHLERAWRLGAYGADPERTAPLGSGTADWRVTLERKIEELEASPPHRGMRGFEAALVSMLLDRQDEALRWLRAARDEGSLGVVMQYYPVFEALQARPEFAALLAEAGLGSAIGLPIKPRPRR